MAVENNKETCNICRFFVSNDRMGVCNRYPESVNKHMANWCGEFVKSNRIPIPEVISLTTNVYDINTDTVITYQPEVAKDALMSIAEQLTSEPLPETPKKPGRPKKVAK